MGIFAVTTNRANECLIDTSGNDQNYINCAEENAHDILPYIKIPSLMKFHHGSALNKLIINGICFSLFATILSIEMAFAQQGSPFFRRISLDNGLSHAKVNCILQDRRGFLWFGTEDGLNRYDGRYFTVFKNKPQNTASISGNIIADLHEDKNGVIWIATADGGLTRYNYRTPALNQFKQFRYTAYNTQDIPDNNISKIAEDGKGYLWLLTGSGHVIRFNVHAETFDCPVKRINHDISSVVMAGQDTLWLGKKAGDIIKLNIHTMQYKINQRQVNPNKKRWRCPAAVVFKDNENSIWFGQRDNLLYNYNLLTHTEKSYEPTTAALRLPQDEISSLAEDRSKNIWLGFKNTGITMYNTTTHRFVKFDHDRFIDGSLADNHVNALLVDREGMVWIGTDNGVSIYDPVYAPFHQYFLPKIKHDIIINDFYKDEHDKLWIATSAGIFTQQSGTNHFDYRKIVYKGHALAATKFFIGKDKTFYLGTNYTLFRYNLQTNHVTPLPQTARDAHMKKLIISGIVSIAGDTLNRHPALAVSLDNHRLIYYDISSKKWILRTDTIGKTNPKINFRDNLIKRIYRDKKGGVWLATTKYGLGNWPLDRSLKYFVNDPNDPSSIINNNVYDIQEDKKGNFWVSSYSGGLNYFTPGDGKFSHIPASSSLTEGIQLDQYGKVWSICNGHLHEYNPLTQIYSCYDPPNLQNQGGIKAYIYKDGNDNMYAGGLNFYIRFNAKTLTKIKNDPDVYFTDFKLLDVSHSQLLKNDVINLTHKQNSFSLEFSAPEYNSNHIHYNYMLVGVDPDWIEADQRNYASYSNLAAGKYVFKVRASNWKGSMVHKFSFVVIIIDPPLWFRWWFLVLTLLIIAFTGYFLYRYRAHERQRQQSIRNGIAQDLHDHVGSTLSSISIYSKVAKIYQEQEKKHELINLLNTIGETANATISEMSDIVWSINPKNDHMDCILEKIQSYARPLCVAQNIDFILHCDASALRLKLGTTIRKNLFLILKEALNNAIKHSSCKTISVAIRLNSHYMQLQIQDDGIGFDPNRKFAGTSKGMSGNGLLNIKSRAKELDAEFKIESGFHHGTLLNLNFSILGA